MEEKETNVLKNEKIKSNSIYYCRILIGYGAVISTNDLYSYILYGNVQNFLLSIFKDLAIFNCLEYDTYIE